MLRSVLALLVVVLCFSPAPSAAQASDSRPDQQIGAPIWITDGSSRLSGSLLLPSGPGPHPAFVALMGSGGASYRDSWREGAFPFWKDIAEFLVARGFAVVLFDKPDVQESTGDWRQQSFDDRADEAIAAVRRLAARSDIDASRVGLVGHSQGGWIAQLAAANHPDEIGFLILLAGPAVSVKQQIRDDVESGWTCRGLSGINGALRRTALNIGLGALGLVAHVAKPGYLARIIHFDPRPILPEIRQPTLALFAEHDPLVVPEANAARLQRHFGTAHDNARLKIVTIPTADHFFRNATLCSGGQRHGEWAPGFFGALGDAEYWSWIRHGVAAPPQGKAGAEVRGVRARSPTAQPPAAVLRSASE